MATDDKRTSLKTKINSKGVKYSLVHNLTKDSYEVWVLRENYDGKVRDGMSKSWRYVEMGLDLDAAEALFNRRTK